LLPVVIDDNPGLCSSFPPYEKRKPQILFYDFVFGLHGEEFVFTVADLGF
jgi:hypothetical protein